MVIKDGDINAVRTVIKSSDGRIARNIKQFNTKTKRAVVYATIIHDDELSRVAVIGKTLKDEGRKVVTFTCHLLGYKAYNKETGEEII